MHPENSTSSRRILVVLPLAYGDDWGFWFRDAGLLVIALRSLGHVAHLVALRTPSQTPAPDQPLFVATKAELEDPAWWKAKNPDAVVFNLWNATRWEGIRSAARQATPRLIEKMDTDGVRSPRTWFWHYLLDTWSSHRDSESVLYRELAAPLAFARAGLLLAFPGLLDRKLAAGMARMPLLAAETPIAVERIKRFIRDLGMPVPRMVCIPHPVDERYVGLDVGVLRQNKLVSVGRWASHQKNFPLLLRMLDNFLEQHPHWTADVVGSLPDHLQSQTSHLSATTLERIRFCGKIPRGDLAKHYQSAKIFVMSSRHESFNIAAAEALCCGCSVVGPAEIASIPFYTGRASGTPACRYSARHLGDALCAEAEAWNLGWRDPAQISADWLKIVGSKVIACQVVEAIESLEA